MTEKPLKNGLAAREPFFSGYAIELPENFYMQGMKYVRLMKEDIYHG
jgi:hypothetical protein